MAIEDKKQSGLAAGLPQPLPDAAGLPDTIDKVIIYRQGDGQFKLMGPAVLLRPFNEIVESLLASDFMRPWLRQQVAQHLRAGGQLSCPGAFTGRPKAVYKLSTPQDLQILRDRGLLDDAVREPGERKSPLLSARYRIAPLATPEPRLKKLPRVARVIIEILSQYTGNTGGEISALEVREILSRQKALLQTNVPVLKKFAQYLRRYEDVHLVERVLEL